MTITAADISGHGLGGSGTIENVKNYDQLADLFATIIVATNQLMADQCKEGGRDLDDFYAAVWRRAKGVEVTNQKTVREDYPRDDELG